MCSCFEAYELRSTFFKRQSLSLFGLTSGKKYQQARKIKNMHLQRILNEYLKRCKTLAWCQNCVWIHFYWVLFKLPASWKKCVTAHLFAEWTFLYRLPSSKNYLHICAPATLCVFFLFCMTTKLSNWKVFSLPSERSTNKVCLTQGQFSHWTELNILFSEKTGLVSNI